MTKYQAEITVTFIVEFTDNEIDDLKDQAFSEAENTLWDVDNIMDIVVNSVEELRTFK